MTILPLVLYVWAAVAYVLHFVGRRPLVGRFASMLLGAAILAHTFHIGMLYDAGRAHAGGRLVGGDFGVRVAAGRRLSLHESTTGERAIGAFITAHAGRPAGDPDAEPAGDIATLGARQSALHRARHVAALRLCRFALACVIGVTYVLLFKEIKARHLGFFYARLPSLDVLDRMNLRAVWVGWICLTVGMAIGALWIVQARGYAPEDARVQAMSLLDPKIFVALVCWAVYTFQIFARQTIGWSGRRSAWLSALGFAIVLLNFLPIAYFFTRSHNFS